MVFKYDKDSNNYIQVDKPLISRDRWVLFYTDLYDMIIAEYHEGDDTQLKVHERDDIRDLITNVMRDHLRRPSLQFKL